MSMSPFMNPALHSHCTCEACLLVACEDALQRTVFYVVAVEDCELNGAADAVVSTQCRAFGSEPFAVDVGLMGSLWKSNSTSTSLSHTMSMWLCRITVGAFSCPLVAGLRMITLPCLVGFCLQSVLLPNSFRYSIICSSCFEGRWNLVNLCKLLENARFQFAITHFSLFLWVITLIIFILIGLFRKKQSNNFVMRLNCITFCVACFKVHAPPILCKDSANRMLASELLRCRLSYAKIVQIADNTKKEGLFLFLRHTGVKINNNNMIKTLLLTLALVAIAMVLLSVKVLLRRNGKF